jgi:hypothetical protein
VVGHPPSGLACPPPVAYAELQRQAEERARVEARRAAAERALSDLTAARAKALGSALPTQIRYQSLTLSHVSAMLAREQRMHMRALLEIFPLRINALRAPSAGPGDAAGGGGGGGGGGPIQITICDLRLPECLAPPPGGWPDPLAVSAALGYLLLLVDKVAFIMGGPVLHEAHPQGSTSSVWVPGAFWDRAPRRQEHVLPLYVPGAGGGSGAAAAAAVAGGSGGGGGAGSGGDGGRSGGGAFWPLGLGGGARGGGGGGSAGGDGLLRRSSSETSSGGGAGGRALGGLLYSRRDADAAAAFALLQRSLACFLRDKAAGSALQLPAAWNPLAWLVVFCAVVKRDAKADGKLVAASLAADAAAGGDAANETAGGPPGGPGARSGRASREGIAGDGGTDSVLALLDRGFGAGGLDVPPLPHLAAQLPGGPWDGAWALDGAVAPLRGRGAGGAGPALLRAHLCARSLTLTTTLPNPHPFCALARRRRRGRGGRGLGRRARAVPAAAPLATGGRRALDARDDNRHRGGRRRGRRRRRRAA